MTADKKTKNFLRVEPGTLFDLAEIMFDQGKDIILTVTGNSMYPFLRSRRDSVEICRAGIKDIKVSDIVLVKRDGMYILHRVFKKTADEFYMIGDAQTILDGPYNKSHLIGKVTAIIRNNKRTPCTALSLRFLVRAWMMVRPVRIKVIRGYGWVRRGMESKKK